MPDQVTGGLSGEGMDESRAPVIVDESTMGYQPGEACGSEGIAMPPVRMEVDQIMERGTKRASTTPMASLDPRSLDGLGGCRADPGVHDPERGS